MTIKKLSTMETNNQLLLAWDAAQPFITQKAKESLPKCSEEEAIEIVKTFFIDQTTSARDVLVEEAWKSAAGIVSFMFFRFPSIVPTIAEWYNRVAKKGAMDFKAETGSWPGYDPFNY